jgi:dolichol kinase
VKQLEELLGALMGNARAAPWAREIRTELIRKSIHLLIGLTPTLAAFNFGLTVALLGSGILVYSYAELLRVNGYEVAVLSKITAMAARKRDMGKFVLGPVTLGLGALISLALYPEPAAAIAIYALAFGDGLSSLVGRTFGTIRLPFTGGKSLEGSITCFIAVLSSAYAVSNKLGASLFIALTASVVEAAPTKDFDNILLPVATGLAAMLALL